MAGETKGLGDDGFDIARAPIAQFHNQEVFDFIFREDARVTLGPSVRNNEIDDDMDGDTDCDDADCLGFGAEPPREPAYLHLVLNGGVGEATASLASEPSRRHYDLLPAVGVDFVGGESKGDRYVARYRNRLQAHVPEIAERIADFMDRALSGAHR